MSQPPARDPDRDPDDERLLWLRCPAPGPGQDPRVELRGELTHFFDPLPLRPSERGDGHLEIALRAPPGVHAYKLRGGDGRWWLDPYNPRTRSRGGLQNSVLCVNGTDEPLLHAVAPPWCFLEDDGRLCLRAALRRNNGVHLRVRALGEPAREVPLRLCAEEDEHLLFEGHLPFSERAIDYLFVLSDGRALGAAGAPGQALRAYRRDLQPRTPAWWRDAVLYTVFVDRFRRGDGAPWPKLAREDDRAGGGLRGVIAALPHLRALGVSVLHLTPLSLSPSAHRYDASDPRRVDPALGGEAALRELLHAAHAGGLRVLLDLALTHVDREHPAFQDVRRRGYDSPYAAWFKLRRFPFSEEGQAPDPGYEHYQKGQWREPLLNLECPEVVDYLAETLQGYLRLGADGLRIDAAADLPPRALRHLCRAARAERPDALLLGEVIPHNGARFLREGLDAVTDFAAQQTLHNWLLGGRDGAEAAAALARRAFDRGPGWRGVLFTATHDQHRLLSLSGDPRVARLAHLYLLTRPEIPALYYGDEIGARCQDPVRAAARDFEGAWPDRQPMSWDPAGWDTQTLQLLTQAIALRRAEPALRGGEERWLRSPGAVLAYRRSEPGDGATLDIYLNGGAAPVTLPLAADAPSAATLRHACGEVTLTPASGEPAPQGAVQLHLGPYAGVVVLRRPPAPLLAVWQAVRAHNRELALQAFVAGQVELPTLPAHLYITITEACNLRCIHCITEAPARTRSGRARTLRPFVIAALREGLAAADYLAFVHGGESLVSPSLWELLAAAQAARADADQGGPPRRRDAHLLSNGMLLTPEVTRRLARAGVTSLAVSIDGASAATNDSLRAGADLATILGHLREALRLRALEHLDLRIGVSSVVTRDNVEELEALGALAAELGLDWLKLEELAPLSGRLQQISIAPSDRRVQAGLSRLRARAKAAGVVVVDHLAPPAGCRCQAVDPESGALIDPALLAFREADDFANRARFAPCRALWEQACVDPDGTVRAVDYAQPPLGELATRSLLDLWNSPTAQRLREHALRRLPARARAACRR